MASAAPGKSSASSASSIRYKAGDVIVAADPFVHALKYPMKGIRCDSCIRKADALKRCAGCSYFYYCDRQCQAKDWQSFHKHGECRFYKKLTSVSQLRREIQHLFQDDNHTAILLRLFLYVKANPERMFQRYQLHDGKTRSLDDLMDCEITSSLQQQMMYRSLSQVDRQLFGASDSSLFNSLYHKLRINSFSIDHMDEKQPNATGLYIETSVFDHSCRSNAAYVFKGKRMEMRAMKDIKEGEEVTIHYVDLTETRDERRKTLLTSWGFLCQCERCEEGESVEEVLRLAAIQRYEHSLKRENMMRFSEQDRHDAIFRGLVDVLLMKEKYMGQYHPEMTFSMYQAANVKSGPGMSMQDKQKFVTLIHKLEKAAAVTHGLGHMFYTDIPLMKTISGIK